MNILQYLFYKLISETETVVFNSYGVYYYSSNKTNFINGTAYCQQLGGHLVAFETEDEHSTLVVPSDEYWIGVNRRPILGTKTWVWDHSEQRLNDTFQAWEKVNDVNNYAVRKGQGWFASSKYRELDIVCELGV